MLFAIATPASQALMDWGLSQAEFAEDGNETLRAAGYAFSIWSVIYAGLIAHAFASSLARAKDEPLLRALSPAIIAIAGCGLWIVASSLNQRWASVAIIVVSAASAWWALRRAMGLARGVKAHLLHVWPLSLLGGWLLIASAINILTVLTAEGLIGPQMALGAGIAGIVVVVTLALLAIRGGVSAVYGIPVAWGLIGVFVAERGDQPVSAYVAIGGAAVVALFAGVIGMRRR